MYPTSYQHVPSIPHRIRHKGTMEYRVYFGSLCLAWFKAVKATLSLANVERREGQHCSVFPYFKDSGNFVSVQCVRCLSG